MLSFYHLLSCQGDQYVRSDQQDKRWDTEKHNSLFEVMEEPCHKGALLTVALPWSAIGFRKLELKM